MKLKPYKTIYDHGNAYWMARLALSVYTKKKDSEIPDEGSILDDLKNEDPEFQSIIGFDKNSAQAMTVEHEKYIAVVFRGTNEWEDWLDNINVIPTDRLFGSFHRGFYQSVMDLWAKIEKSVKKFRATKKRPVWFTGHSLGGAMATIAAAIYVYEDRPFSGVYTFGQPRCMNREAARIFNMETKERFFRFQNNNDIVTRIPARAMGYSHVGNCIYISQEGELCGSPGFWFKFLDAVDGALEAFGEKGIDGIEDHDMSKYLTAIKEWKDQPLKED